MSSPTRPERLELATEATYHHGYTRRDRSDELQRELLVFSLGAEEYACDIRRIREILKVRPITEVPRAPAFVLGIVAVRGRVIPIIDLRMRLRMPVAPSTKDSRILIVTKDGEPFGLLVDRVRQVVRMREEEVEPAPTALAAAETDFLAGIGRPPGGRILILLHIDAAVTFALKAVP